MIIFMGVTGAGKSIQGQLLAEKLNIPWLSTGELLRAQADNPDHATMLAGKLLDDQQMIELVGTALEAIPNHECVLDGFPRTHVQAGWLINQIHAGNIKLEAIIYLVVSEPVMAARLQGRGRPDDTDDAIKQRFISFQQTTLPLVNELRGSGISLLEVDGEKSIEEVHQAILTMLGIDA
jgi:adenylate kinase